MSVPSNKKSFEYFAVPWLQRNKQDVLVNLSKIHKKTKFYKSYHVDYVIECYYYRICGCLLFMGMTQMANP